VFPEVRYSYGYGGRIYDAARLALDTDYCGAQARSIAERYSPGQRVHVYVNPANPSEAALVVGDPQLSTMWLLVSGLVGTGVSIAFLVGALRRRT
jgi:hypothetical protein